MKTTQKSIIFAGLLMAAAGTINQAQAYDRDHNRDGYRDHQGHWRHYENYHNHRGYWDQQNGVRVFINI